MPDVFNSNGDNRIWVSLEDIPAVVLQTYRNRFQNRSHASFEAEEASAFAEREHRSIELIRVASEEISKLSNYIQLPHLFLFTDQECVVLFLQHPVHMTEAIQSIGLKKGVSFAMEELGASAISLAKEMQSMAVVRSSEHDVELLAKWNCVCTPIRQDNQTVGYLNVLNVSFSSSYDVDFTVPMLLVTANRIEHRINGESTVIQRESLEIVFNGYGMTTREKQAAYGWLMNYSVLRIAEEMGITEGTVRNLLKKVYAKARVCDKGQFFRTFGS